MPSGSPRQQTRQCTHCGNDFQYAVRRGRPNTFCSPACRAAARSSSAEPPDLTRYNEDLGATAEDLQLSATTLLAAVHGGEDTDDLMGQVTDHYRFLKDVEAAVVARGRARGDSWMQIAEAAGSGAESYRKKWTQDKVSRRLTRAREARRDRQAASGRPDAADRAGCAPLPPAQTPGEQFAAAMVSLQRSTGLTIKDTASRIGVSPSYVSRILAGTRRPSWPIVEAFVETCEGRSLEMRALWEAAQRTPDHQQEPVPEDPDEARAQLHTALRALYLAADRPDLWDVKRAVSTGTKPSIREISLALNGTRIPDWETTAKIIMALRGSPAEFRPLWQAASPPSTTSALQAAAFG
ncbi:helix-turn-helix domain-containing protein [Streptomyces gardneri]|uniref:helix-turn-helix domain-containing protein n=1 Tax=Streptomyces gardneri TaxID=66892 RepID=UPI0036B206C4